MKKTLPDKSKYDEVVVEDGGSVDSDDDDVLKTSARISKYQEKKAASDKEGEKATSDKKSTLRDYNPLLSQGLQSYLSSPSDGEGSDEGLSSSFLKDMNNLALKSFDEKTKTHKKINDNERDDDDDDDSKSEEFDLQSSFNSQVKASQNILHLLEQSYEDSDGLIDSDDEDIDIDVYLAGERRKRGRGDSRRSKEKDGGLNYMNKESPWEVEDSKQRDKAWDHVLKQQIKQSQKWQDTLEKQNDLSKYWEKEAKQQQLINAQNDKKMESKQLKLMKDKLNYTKKEISLNKTTRGREVPRTSTRFHMKTEANSRKQQHLHSPERRRRTLLNKSQSPTKKYSLYSHPPMEDDEDEDSDDDLLESRQYRRDHDEKQALLEARAAWWSGRSVGTSDDLIIAKAKKMEEKLLKTSRGGYMNHTRASSNKSFVNENMNTVRSSSVGRRKKKVIPRTKDGKVAWC